MSATSSLSGSPLPTVFATICRHSGDRSDRPTMGLLRGFGLRGERACLSRARASARVHTSGRVAVVE
eukprot:4008897-Prymnesium_polylepis.1